MVIMIGAMACGQLQLNVSDPSGFKLFILISVLLSLALLPVLLSVAPAPSLASLASMGLRQLYHNSPLGLIDCMAVVLSYGAVVGVGMIYAERIGFPLSDISIFMGLILLGSVVLQWPIGHLSDKHDRRWVNVILVITLLTAVVALVAILASQVSANSLLTAAFLFGGLSFPMYSLCVSHTKRQPRSETNGYRQRQPGAAVGIGATLGPSTAAAVMGLVRPNGLFWFLALVHTGFGVFALYHMTLRRAMPLAGKARALLFQLRLPRWQ